MYHSCWGKRNRKENAACSWLATGSSPIKVYEELVRMHKEGLSFSNVIFLIWMNIIQ
jgi:glucosamine-6-phosphate deaminase